MPQTTIVDGCTACCPAPPPSEVTVDCCVNPIPTVLYLTVVAAGAGCDCMDGTYTLTYDASDTCGGINPDGAWITASPGESLCGGSGIRFSITCDTAAGNIWKFRISNLDCGGGSCTFSAAFPSELVVTCDPFEAVSGPLALSGLCKAVIGVTCTGDVTFTITE